MANRAVTIQEVLAGALAPIGGQEAAGALARQMERLTDQLRLVQAGGDAAVAEAKSAGREKDSGTRSAVGASVLTGVGTALGVTSLVLGIAKLFGGGESKTEVPLAEFALPDPVRLNAGVSESVPGGPFLVDYGQGGAPRAKAAAPAPAQITVQVQAMDSRSFMDHSGDIARAVRQAMLESSVLSDLIREA